MFFFHRKSVGWHGIFSYQLVVVLCAEMSVVHWPQIYLLNESHTSTCRNPRFIFWRERISNGTGIFTWHLLEFYETQRCLQCLTKLLHMNEYSSCFTMARTIWAFLSSGGGGFFILILNVSFNPPLVGNPNQKLLHLALWTWVGSSRCNVHTLIFQFPSICVANIRDL